MNGSRFHEFGEHFKVQRVSIIRDLNHDRAIYSEIVCVDCAESSGILIGHDMTTVSFSEPGNNKVMHENTSRFERRRRNIRKSPDVWIAITCRHSICQVISQVNDDVRATS